jgi:hypothetical protein
VPLLELLLEPEVVLLPPSPPLARALPASDVAGAFEQPATYAADIRMGNSTANTVCFMGHNQPQIDCAGKGAGPQKEHRCNLLRTLDDCTHSQHAQRDCHRGKRRECA